MAKTLFLVRGNEVDGENQDIFVVADNPQEAHKLWNEWCVSEEYPRDWGDTESDPNKTFDPENIRVIVKDVTGTEYDGKPSEVVDWEELTVVG